MTFHNYRCVYLHYLFNFKKDVLSKNTSLEKLEISGNRLGDKGGKVIAEVLTVNKTLTDLDISGNLLTNETGHLLAKTLETNNRKLEKLNLLNNLFTEATFLTKLSKYVKDLKSNVGKTVICDGIQEF